MEGTFKSKDNKFTLTLTPEGNDIKLEMSMPSVSGVVKGVLKNRNVAQLNYKVNQVPVFSFLFVEENADGSLKIRASGRSTGRYKGHIPFTDLYKVD